MECLRCGATLMDHHGCPQRRVLCWTCRQWFRGEHYTPKPPTNQDVFNVLFALEWPRWQRRHGYAA
jgi:hypothetical protein